MSSDHSLLTTPLHQPPQKNVKSARQSQASASDRDTGGLALRPWAVCKNVRHVAARVGALDHLRKGSATTTGQLVALRFCSDEELPELTRSVLGGELKTREDIKLRIKNWRPDTLRV